MPRWNRIAINGLLAAGVAAFVAIIHSPGLGSRATFVDDDHYLVENTDVSQPTLEGVARQLTHPLNPPAWGYYQPLTILSLMADSARGGSPQNLAPYRQTSLILHVLNSLLVMLLIGQLLGDRRIAALCGLLFGTLPLSVDSITWVADRKTVLSAFFSLACLCGYVHYARTGLKKWYTLAILLLVAALLAKPLAAAVVVFMIALDCWPLCRLSRRSLIEKLPAAALVGVSAWVTAASQAHSGLAAVQAYRLSAGNLPLVFCHNLTLYLETLIAPATVSPWYPFPTGPWLDNPAMRAGLLITPLLLLGAAVALKWTRAPAVGLIILASGIAASIPGILAAGTVIAANRFVYLPIIGVLLLVAWTLNACRVHPGKTIRHAGVLLSASLMIAVLLYAAFTRREYQHRQDSRQLYRYALSRSPDDVTLLNNLGFVLLEEGEPMEAAECFERIAVVNGAADAWVNLLLALHTAQQYGRAVERAPEAIRTHPNDAEIRLNYGLCLAALGRAEDALSQYEKAVSLRPDWPLPHLNAAELLFKLGRSEEAQRHADHARELGAGPPSR